MKKNRKTYRFFSFVLSLITIFSLFSVLSSASALADEAKKPLGVASKSDDETVVNTGENVMQSAFSGKTIRTCKYIYI